ncbi:hypothetical protein OUZ56_014223 [Daphnia magna]|uniref:Uncharacterized protein n=1 Tax=Daphnia magna TaxID=35525 RepID=A0ABQ9Z882_9CRUS|nr:hypothetical protein OUZ56_014223 [Daphnia magna]
MGDNRVAKQQPLVAPLRNYKINRAKQQSPNHPPPNWIRLPERLPGAICLSETRRPPLELVHPFPDMSSQFFRSASARVVHPSSRRERSRQPLGLGLVLSTCVARSWTVGMLHATAPRSGQPSVERTGSGPVARLERTLPPVDPQLGRDSKNRSASRAEYRQHLS